MNPSVLPAEKVSRKRLVYRNGETLTMSANTSTSTDFILTRV